EHGGGAHGLGRAGLLVLGGGERGGEARAQPGREQDRPRGGRGRASASRRARAACERVRRPAPSLAGVAPSRRTPHGETPPLIPSSARQTNRARARSEAKSEPLRVAWRVPR